MGRILDLATVRGLRPQNTGNDPKIMRVRFRAPITKGAKPDNFEALSWVSRAEHSRKWRYYWAGPQQNVRCLCPVGVNAQPHYGAKDMMW
ncbi:hypothetical protein NBRC116598_17880 [Pseudophaeobacter arcticus]|uniref:Uncharacterized protein n=1 Tax=Pseudophaeobacter arcticus TaxID=385492 RepID=A0ABQ0AKH7_9RHOB